jgi:hypothetical protein
MLKMNISMHTIHLHPCYCAHKSFSEGRSYLISRRIGFGRASVPSNKLAQLRTMPRFCSGTSPSRYQWHFSFWMLLSGNPEVAFPSTSTEHAPLHSLVIPFLGLLLQLVILLLLLISLHSPCPRFKLSHLCLARVLGASNFYLCSNTTVCSSFFD